MPSMMLAFLLIALLLLPTAAADDGSFCAYTKSMRFCKQTTHRPLPAVRFQTVPALDEYHPLHIVLDVLGEQQQQQIHAMEDDLDDLKDLMCRDSKQAAQLFGRADTQYDWLHNATSAGAVWTAIERDLLAYVLRDCDSSQQPPAALTTIGTYRELLSNAAAAAVDSSSGVLARLEHVRATEGMQEVEQMLEDWERCAKAEAEERSHEGLRMFLQELDNKCVAAD